MARSMQYEKEKWGDHCRVFFVYRKSWGGAPQLACFSRFPLIPPFVSRSACWFFPGVGRYLTADACQGGGLACTICIIH